MAAAVRALELGSLSVGVWRAPNGCRDFLIERWPATMSVKLFIGSIEVGVAPSADISTCLKKVVVLSRERLFRALGFDHKSFLRRKWIVV